MKIITINITTLVALLLVNSLAYSQTNQKSILVHGTASISVANTQAKISTSIKTQAVTADEAMANNSAKVQEIIDSLVSAGISLEDIKTSYFSFTPVYTWIRPEGSDNHVRVFEGYSVNNGLSIKVSNISTVGLILDLIVTSGTSTIDNVSFSPTEINSSYLQALTLASQNAYIKAENLAQASSVSLGKAIKITSSSPNYNYTSNYNTSSLDSGSASGATILPNNNKITANVTIEYAIVSNN